MNALVDSGELLGRIIGLFLVSAALTAFVVGTWAMIGRPCNKAQIKATFAVAICAVLAILVMGAAYESTKDKPETLTRRAGVPATASVPIDAEREAKLNLMFSEAAAEQKAKAENDLWFTSVKPIKMDVFVFSASREPPPEGADLFIGATIENVSSKKIVTILMDIMIFNRLNGTESLRERAAIHVESFPGTTVDIGRFREDRRDPSLKSMTQIPEYLQALGTNWTWTYSIVGVIPEGLGLGDRFYYPKSHWVKAKPD